MPARSRKTSSSSPRATKAAAPVSADERTDEDRTLAGALPLTDPEVAVSADDFSMVALSPAETDEADAEEEANVVAAAAEVAVSADEIFAAPVSADERTVLAIESATGAEIPFRPTEAAVIQGVTAPAPVTIAAGNAQLANAVADAAYRHDEDAVEEAIESGDPSTVVVAMMDLDEEVLSERRGADASLTVVTSYGRKLRVSPEGEPSTLTGPGAAAPISALPGTAVKTRRLVLRDGLLTVEAIEA